MGNDDRNSQVRHVVYGLLTRYLRFRPQAHQGGVCMRTEVFGVEQKPGVFVNVSFARGWPITLVTVHVTTATGIFTLFHLLRKLRTAPLSVHFSLLSPLCIQKSHNLIRGNKKYCILTEKNNEEKERELTT